MRVAVIAAEGGVLCPAFRDLYGPVPDAPTLIDLMEIDRRMGNRREGPRLRRAFATGPWVLTVDGYVPDVPDDSDPLSVLLDTAKLAIRPDEILTWNDMLWVVYLPSVPPVSPNAVWQLLSDLTDDPAVPAVTAAYVDLVADNVRPSTTIREGN